MFAAATVSQAQIVYVRPDGNVNRLRQINADGSGDAALALPFPNIALPIWSRDTSMIAVTGVDPARPDPVTQNAFVVNTGTGAITNVTRFEDFVGRDQNGDFNGAYSYTFAFYKAFSPDARFMAVNSLVRSRGPGGTGSAGESITPVLQIFPTDGSGGPLATVHVDPFRDNVHHGGEGVDWAHGADVLVAPRKWDAPLASGKPGRGEATALFFFEPNNSGKSAQLSFPRADHVDNGPFGEHILWGEHDYAPKFSPNDTAVAYIRSFQAVSSFRGRPDGNRMSIRIIDLSTGNDREVIRFEDEGLYINAIDWSPDGTQLIFDMGQQLQTDGFYAQLSNPQTVALYIVNADGSRFRQFLGPASGTPAWKPFSTPTPPPQTPARLGNISTRLRVGVDSDALIGGFIITGNEPKNVIIRAIGPSLGAAGVQGALSNPALELNSPDGVIASNDNWGQSPRAGEIPNGFAPSDERESVIVTTLQPGSYTAVVRGVGGETGLGLIEAYDLSSGGNSLLANISTRGRVETGENVLIGGFIAVGSGGEARVVVRALGPSLAAAGVAEALPDPTLELVDANGSSVHASDNWKDGQRSELEALGLQPSNDFEAALIAAVTGGNYTAVVRGKDNTTGVGLVEVYNVQ